MIGIYKIWNDINNKIYIGKTTEGIEQRWKIHIRDAYKDNMKNRPLYYAIRKYGYNHFHIEWIEQCDQSLLSEREKYWIKYYNSYENGYNATYGGDGTILYDYDLIRTLLEERKTTKQIKEIVNCCEDVIHKVAKIYDIKIEQPEDCLKTQMIKSKKSVKQYDLNGNFIQEFESYSDAAKWLVANNYITKESAGGARQKIGLVCNGVRKTAYKFKWTN